MLPSPRQAGGLQQQQQQQIAQQIMQRLQRQRSSDMDHQPPPSESRERAASVAVTGATATDTDQFRQPSATMRRLPPPLPPKPRSSDALGSSGSGTDVPVAAHTLTRRFTTEDPGAISWRRSRALRHVTEHEEAEEYSERDAERVLEDDHDGDGTPPPLPELPLPVRLMGQEDIKDKLYSSRGISRRMTSGDTLHEGTTSQRGIPTIVSESTDDRIAVGHAMVQDDAVVADSTTSPAAATTTKPTTTTTKEKEKEGLLNYLSTWLLYRPSATVLAAKNILTAGELPPAAPTTGCTTVTAHARTHKVV
jgi:hypothetical protein